MILSYQTGSVLSPVFLFFSKSCSARRFKTRSHIFAVRDFSVSTFSCRSNVFNVYVLTSLCFASMSFRAAFNVSCFCQFLPL